MYKDFKMQGRPEFFKFSTSHGKGIARIYVELLDGQRYLLPELPENAVSQLLPNRSVDSGPPPSEVYYRDADSIITYREGKVSLVSVQASSKLFRISARKEGPYLALPISRKMLVQEFGEPLEWQIAPRHSSGP